MIECRLISILTFVLSSSPVILGICQPRDYGYGSVVCVDDASHCDLPGSEPLLPSGQIFHIASDKAGQRFKTTWIPTQASVSNKSDTQVQFIVDMKTSYQTVEGFGGAFTDAAGQNIFSMSSEIQDCILQSYFGDKGIGYNMGRVPIGGSDFSSRAYSYDDLNKSDTDPGLQKFALQYEDLKYKIPLIKRALDTVGTELLLLASPWSAPAWMKTNNELNGKGSLLPQYWATYAQYIIRFLSEYKLNGINFWALTPQNEPLDGRLVDFPFNAMGWTDEEQAEWIGRYLGPALHNSSYNRIKIFVLDDNRLSLPQWLRTVMSNKQAVNFVSGVAVHWYLDFIIPASVLDRTHEEFPQIPILYTEACTGQWPWTLKKVALGSWQRAQNYVDDVIDILNHWSTGWLDWNLALDMRGGPNWVENFVDAPIIVDATAHEAYKQPMYYAIGHVSKFVRRGSKRLRLKMMGPSRSLSASAFTRPDGAVVVVVLNKKRSPVQVEIGDDKRSSGKVWLTASSINTFLWRY